MSNDLLFVQYNGQWMNEVNYQGYEVCGIFHKENESFDDLLKAVEKVVEDVPSDARLVIKYQIKEGYKPIKIGNETILRFWFYKELKKKRNRLHETAALCIIGAKEVPFHYQHALKEELQVKCLGNVQKDVQKILLK
ncbi:galactose oxidase/kelch repeat superfamily protein [Striga asiatica]|uniref:Galactose oxidase/kelch repeat superfamily protein n=1 Tax=Striga asiatica TaxID=4170 RepID=A0A5A7PGY7_STRAF|nr:galactose oxidase/kelch repeat superfamily protein [Striga asiatica]